MLFRSLGGTAAAATRYAVGAVSPLGVTTLRYTIGAICLLAFAVPAARKLEDSRRWLATVGLSVLFYGIYPYLFTLWNSGDSIQQLTSSMRKMQNLPPWQGSPEWSFRISRIMSCSGARAGWMFSSPLGEEKGSGVFS